MVHLSKLCCYSNRWLWFRLNFADMLKMERYPLFSFFLFLGQKLTIVEHFCNLQGHITLTSCHVLTAKYPNYLLSYSAFFWHILLYKYFTQYVSLNNNYVFFDTTIVQLWVWLMTIFKKINDVACFFHLNTTWKGKLFNQIELKLPNAFYICLNTFTSYHWLSNILNINFDSY